MSNTAKPTLPHGLNTITASEALQDLLDLDTTWHLIPEGAHEHFMKDLEQLTTACERLNVKMNTLFDQLPHLVHSLTGLTVTFHQFLGDDASAALHHYRNLAVTLMLATVAANFTTDNDVLAAAPRTKSPRTRQINRGLTDDEVLLLRVTAHLMTKKDPRAHQAAVYVLVEAGMTPAETSLVLCADVDDMEAPSIVNAKGRKQLKERLLELDDFGRLALSRTTNAALCAGRSRTTNLLFSPRKDADPSKPRNSATATASGKLDRFMEAAGLKHRDVTASSARLWRIQNTYNQHGVQAAMYLSGVGGTKTSNDRLLRLVHNTAALPIVRHRPTVTPSFG